jgi:hypothetical protein
MTKNAKPNFWDGDSPHQPLADALLSLVPMVGETPDAANNPKLERFRCAVKVYYDIFNNGGGNRESEVRPTFGINLERYRNEGGSYPSLDFDRLKADLETPLATFAIEAAAEQLYRLPRARG